MYLGLSFTSKKERIIHDSFFPSTCFSLPLLHEYDVRPYGRRVFPLLAQLILHELLAVALLNLCAPYFLNNLSFSREHAQSHASQSIIHRGVCSASECARARSSSFPHNFTNGIRCTSAHFFTLCEDKAIQNTFYIFTIKYRFFMHFLVFVSLNANLSFTIFLNLRIILSTFMPSSLNQQKSPTYRGERLLLT